MVSPVFSISIFRKGLATAGKSILRLTSVPSSNRASPSRYLPFSPFCSSMPSASRVEARRCAVLFASPRRFARSLMPSSYSPSENTLIRRMALATEERRALDFAGFDLGSLMRGTRSGGLTLGALYGEMPRPAMNWNLVPYKGTCDAARKGSNPLARTGRHPESRLRGIQETADTLRRLHGVGRHSRLSRPRHPQSAGPAACAVEAHRRARSLYPAPRHRDQVGLLCSRGTLRQSAEPREAHV